MTLDTSYRERRLRQRLDEDPVFRAEYERAEREIAGVDSLMRMLDDLREGAGVSKADLARAISRNPASVRRWFTGDANPELKTVVALADALDAEVVIRPRKGRRRHHRETVIA
jgi:ribosome-binding protein aMBF1 (putative translation factor)